MELMLQPLRKYADFQGRARRSEYWLFYLFYLVIYFVLFAIMAAGGGMADGGSPGPLAMIGGALLGIFVLAMLVPSLAVSFRRLHDTNRSAWWLLIAFIPFLGAIVLLVFLVMDGTAGPNRFGPDPKSRGTAEVFA